MDELFADEGDQRTEYDQDVGYVSGVSMSMFSSKFSPFFMCYSRRKDRMRFHNFIFMFALLSLFGGAKNFGRWISRCVYQLSQSMSLTIA